MNPDSSAPDKMLRLLHPLSAIALIVGIVIGAGIFKTPSLVAGISGDSHLTIYNADTHKTVFCKPGHEGCSVLNGFVDPTGNFVASIGSDSNINIYKFIND